MKLIHIVRKKTVIVDDNTIGSGNCQSEEIVKVFFCRLRVLTYTVTRPPYTVINDFR